MPTYHKEQDCGVGGKNCFYSDALETEEEARAIVEKNPGETMGYVKQSDGIYVVARVGAEKGHGPGSEFYYPIVENLPQDPAGLKDDGFIDKDEAATKDGYELKRPGRNQGFGDELHLKLFSTISPTDLHQGGLGDCWLICSLAVLAEYPDAIQNIIQPGVLAEDGGYTVSLYSHKDKDKKPKEPPQQIFIDDRLATQDGSCAFVHMSLEGEIWPCLIEKAFAKLSKSYGNLDGGQPLFAFGCVTGCFDLVSYDLKEDGSGWNECKWNYAEDTVQSGGGSYNPDEVLSHEDVMNKLGEFNDKNYLMAVGSVATATREEQDAKGIVHGHAYSLLDVKKGIAGDDGNTYDLLQLRNPWGEKEWNGAWSDDSDLWEANKNIAAECGWVKKDDGIFWISFEDFRTEYSTIYVCQKDMGLNRSKQGAGDGGLAGDSFHMKKKRGA